MRPVRPHSRSLPGFCSLLLSYLLVLSLFTPLTLNRAAAVTTRKAAGDSSSKKAKATPPVAAQTDTTTRRWREGEILVRFRAGASPAEIDALLSSSNAKRAGQLRGQSGIERLQLAAGSDPEAVAQSLSKSALIDLAEPNYLITADQVAVNDPRFSEQWALRNTGQNNGSSGSDISAEGGWKVTAGSPRTVIAVLDGGIDFTHPELKNNEWSNVLENRNNNRDDDQNGFTDDLNGWDFVTDSAVIKDEQGHGTAVAGIIAAEGNNARGTTGVMWRAGLMSLRVLDSTGTGDVAGAVEALDYAVQNGAQVVNCSWGTDSYSGALFSAIYRASRRGVVVVTSAGNGGGDIETTPHYPASFDLQNVISVAATDSSDRLAQFSNRGERHVTVAAPGQEILTTKQGGDYQTVSGTSAAAPFVTGVVGLLKSRRPWLDVIRTREMVIRGARQVDALSGKVMSRGVISAAGALGELSMLLPGEGMDEDGGNNGGEHGNDGQGRAAQGSAPPGGAERHGNPFSVNPPPRIQGAPGPGLPDLDDMKRRQPTPPKAPDPIPSTKCSHRNPDCQNEGRRAALDSPANLLAANQYFPSVTALFANQADFLSDSPFKLTWLPPAAMFPQPQTTRSNVALSANGSVATASSVYAGYPLYPSAAIDGDHKGLNFPGGGGAWHSATATFPQWLQIDFNGSKTLDEIDVYTLQDAYSSPSEPTPTMTFSLYGLTGYEVQYWNGSAWADVSGGNISGNNLVWKQLTFSQITTNKIRVLTNAAADGMSRIVELEAWGTAATSPDPSGNNYSMARTDPYNRTGSGGVDLLSGNANWSLPIVGLKGRAGLDLGLSLSYNSLVWTKDTASNSIKFDVDQGSPSPGFRLGFPVIQPLYYNSQAGVNSYLLITPGGGHVELRQTATSGVYESADSSHLQLTAGGGGLILQPTDGSQLTYTLLGGQYQCTQVKDSNGNFVTVSYTSDGSINTVTDTLGRVLTFNYDINLNLLSITQQWGGTTTPPHEWATFGWGTQAMSPSFSGLTAVGPQSGMTIPVLTQIGFADGSRYNFDYNAYGQVTKVHHYAKDNHERAYTTYTYGASNGDCPRVTDTREWAENWNNNQEATTGYSIAGITGDHSVGQMNLPDNKTTYKELYGTANWQRGLTVGSEYWAYEGQPGSETWNKKKWTSTTYTQDNTSLPYLNNPLVTETHIDDSTNHRKTTIDYGPGSGPGNGQYAKWGLPYNVTEYDADGVTPLRRTYTDYNLDPAYIGKHIIGLVSEVHVSDMTKFVSKTVYTYDEGGDAMQATTVNATQHDAAYAAGLNTSRGNVTSVSRYDATDLSTITNSALAHTTRIGYDADGSVIFTRDASGHQSNISYTDSFSAGGNRNTFAYPTIATPPLASGESASTFSTTTQYNYDFGAVTQVRTPTPYNNTTTLPAPIQDFTYDAAGRLQWVNDQTSGRPWKFFAYPDRQDAVQTQTALNTAAGTSYYQITLVDGAGRLMAEGGDNPDSTGHYWGRFTEYDVMGRAVSQTNPTEVNNIWAPVGDDAGGWVKTLQAYDWKGRPTRTTNPDGTTRQISYTGCGCAGGEIMTVQDEVGRQQRIISDIFGRTKTTEVWFTDANQVFRVYSSTTNDYNARDQITRVVETDAVSGASQTTTMGYDGYGRLIAKRTPEQTADTQYTYNDDDTPSTVTDGRNVTTTYNYNNPRHQVKNIHYSTFVPATTDINFAYDAAGNRTSMTDGTGSTSYNYDQYSRLKSETRHFNDLASNSMSGNYTLSYEYTLSGSLKKLTDPFGAYVEYTHDPTGRLTGVTGSAYGGVATYASNVRYRAWGGVSSATFGDGDTQTTSYDSRLRPTEFHLTASWDFGKLNETFQYYDDSRLRTLTDLDDGYGYGSNFPNNVRHMSRSYYYDQVGRVTFAGSTDTTSGYFMTPFRQTYEYDAFNNLTKREGTISYSPTLSDSGTYSNHKRNGWSYDADGRLVSNPAGGTDHARTWQYDAAGRLTLLTDTPVGGTASTLETLYDGDGLSVKETGTGAQTAAPNYLVHSSVLGGEVLTRLDASGNKLITYVKGGGVVNARQAKDYQGIDQMQWQHFDPVGVTEAGGELASYDPLGNYVKRESPPQGPPSPPQVYYGPAYGWTVPWMVNSTSFGTGCTMNGGPADCNSVVHQLTDGWASPTHQLAPPGVQITFNPMPMGIGPYGNGGAAPTWVSDWRKVPSHLGPGGERVEDGMDVVTINTGERDFGHWVMVPGSQNVGPDVMSQNPTYPTTEMLRAGVEKLLSKRACGELVENIINEVHNQFPKQPFISDYILDLFDMVSSQGGFKFEQAIVGGEPADGTTGGYLVKDMPGEGPQPNRKPASVIITPHLPPKYPNATDTQIYYLLTAIGELMHLSGQNYSDRQLALAASKVSGIPGLPLTNGMDENSTYFHHKVINIVCNPRSK